MARNRFQRPAPSIAAASKISPGMFCRPAAEDEERQAGDPREVDEDQRPQGGVRVAEPVLLKRLQTDLAQEAVQHADVGVVDELPGEDLDHRGEGERDDQQVAEEQAPARPGEGDQQLRRGERDHPHRRHGHDEDDPDVDERLPPQAVVPHGAVVGQSDEGGAEAGLPVRQGVNQPVDVGVIAEEAE